MAPPRTVPGEAGAGPPPAGSEIGAERNAASAEEGESQVVTAAPSGSAALTDGGPALRLVTVAPEGRETLQTRTDVCWGAVGSNGEASRSGAPCPELVRSGAPCGSGRRAGGLESQAGGAGHLRPPLASTSHMTCPARATPPGGLRPRSQRRPGDTAVVPATRPWPPSARACWSRQASQRCTAPARTRTAPAPTRTAPGTDAPLT